MKLCSTSLRKSAQRMRLVVCLLLCVAFLPTSQYVAAEGSRSLYPESYADARANLEWRTSAYGTFLLRRTLLKVYAEEGEYILMGSSAVDVPDTPDQGDILIFRPGLVTGPIGQETIPDTASFSCREQRTQTGNLDQGRMSSRTEELRGPDTIVDTATAARGNAIADGYVPCFYQAPETGIYDVVFFGPAGPGEDYEIPPTGQISDTPDNFTATQATSVAMWDVTVRASLTSTIDLRGRLFTYYLTMFTGRSGRPVSSIVYVVCNDGFIYEVDLRGMDPIGFVLYANQVGFLDSDGTPLHRDVMAVDTLSFQGQNQLMELQGGTSLAPPDFPIFFNLPDPAALTALGIPLEPVPPQVSNFTFTGTVGDDTTVVGEGGTFRFTTNVEGTYQIVISRDGDDFDPTNPENAALRGVIADSGDVTVEWDGLDESRNPFPPGQDFVARVVVKNGEVHLPFLDVENSINGGPSFTMINPPNGECPPFEGGCSGAFYDDRGYLTAEGTLVGVEVNGALCPGAVGNPPEPRFSDPLRGFDSRSAQRAFGFPEGGNPQNICDEEGGFGDKKGLDMWTYYPSAAIVTPVRVLSPTAIELTTFAATPQAGGIAVNWETSAEINTWGFHLLRSSDGTRDNAVRVTPALILGQGRGQGGADYTWIDTDAQVGNTYAYWLQEVELDGSTNEYGPITVSYDTSAISTRIFLPLVLR